MASVRALFVLIVLALVAPSEAAIIPGAEIPVDPVTATVHADGWNPQIASNGRDALAVWIDVRAYPENAVRASRLHDGVPADAEDLVITESRYGFSFAGVASNGDGYLVVFSGDGTSAARVTDDGRVTRNTAIEAGEAMDVVSNGTTYCVLTDDSGLWPHRRAVFLDGDTTVLAEVEVPVTSERLIALGGNYWIVANDPLELIPLSPAGTGQSRLLDDEDVRVSAIAGPDHMLIAWHSRGSLGYVVLDQGGNPVLAPTTLDYRLPYQWDYPPSLAWDGSEFLLSWQLVSRDADAGKMGGIRIGTDAVPRNAEPFVVAGPHHEPRFSAAFDGRQVVLVDVEGYGGDAVLKARTIDSFAAHTPREGVPLSSRGEPQSARAVAASGATVLAVWAELPRLRGVLRQPDGTMTLIEIATQGTSHSVWWTMAASVTAAGDGFLVTWRDWHQPQQGQSGWHTLAKRIRKNGEVVDSEPLVIAASSELPAVASDGTRFLVAWRDTTRIRGVVIPPDGAMGAQMDLVTARRTNPPHLTVAWTGSAYVVSWSSDEPDGHRFIRVSADGIALGPTEILALAGAWSGSNGPLAIARNEDRALAVWQERDCLMSLDLSADGHPESTPRTLVCSPAVGSYLRVSVSWIAGTWLVLWSRSFDPDRVHGVRAGANGRRLGDVFTIDTHGGREITRGHAIAGDKLFLLFDRVVAEPPYRGTRRAFLRPVLFDPELRRGRAVRH